MFLHPGHVFPVLLIHATSFHSAIWNHQAQFFFTISLIYLIHWLCVSILLPRQEKSNASLWKKHSAESDSTECHNYYGVRWAVFILTIRWVAYKNYSINQTKIVFHTLTIQYNVFNKNLYGKRRKLKYNCNTFSPLYIILYIILCI